MPGPNGASLQYARTDVERALLTAGVGATHRESGVVLLAATAEPDAEDRLVDDLDVGVAGILRGVDGLRFRRHRTAGSCEDDQQAEQRGVQGDRDTRVIVTATRHKCLFLLGVVWCWVVESFLRCDICAAQGVRTMATYIL